MACRLCDCGFPGWFDLSGLASRGGVRIVMSATDWLATPQMLLNVASSDVKLEEQVGAIQCGPAAAPAQTLANRQRFLCGPGLLAFAALHSLQPLRLLT
jgi:hypothetical protein